MFFDTKKPTNKLVGFVRKIKLYEHKFQTKNFVFQFLFCERPHFLEKNNIHIETNFLRQEIFQLYTYT